MPAVEHSSPPLSEPPDPVPVVESVPPAVELPSSPSSGQSSSVSSQTLAWGDAGDSSVPLSPNRVQAGHSQDVPDEGSLFHVSPVSLQFLFRPSGAAQQLPPDGVLLPTMLDDFNISVLGEPITYARCEQIMGSDSILSLPVYALPSGSALMPGQSLIQSVLASGTSSRPEVGSSAVAPPMDMEDCPLLETGLPGRPYRFTECSGQPFSDGNPAFGLQLHHPRFLEFVGAKYMSAMGLWCPEMGPGDPGPVPASSCRSCMTCEYCFPEDKLPPG